MQKMLTHPIVLILLIIVIAILGGGTYYSIQKGQAAYGVYVTNSETQKNLKDLEEKLNMLIEENKNKPMSYYPEIIINSDIFPRLFIYIHICLYLFIDKFLHSLYIFIKIGSYEISHSAFFFNFTFCTLPQII